MCIRSKRREPRAVRLLCRQGGNNFPYVKHHTVGLIRRLSCERCHTCSPPSNHLKKRGLLCPQGMKMQWQFYPSLGFHYSRTYVSGYEHIGCNNIYVKVLCLGPLQMRWYSTGEGHGTHPPLRNTPSVTEGT